MFCYNILNALENVTESMLDAEFFILIYFYVKLPRKDNLIEPTEPINSKEKLIVIKHSINRHSISFTL